MNVKEILSKSEKPKIYEKGTALMWSDEHISKQLLAVHLNPDVELASRKRTTIEKTADWILGNVEGEKLEILDLGCGPGLYTEIYAQQGHNVTGVDISKNSIEYASKSAAEKNLPIEYIDADYTDLDLQAEKYDLVTMIYTDFGVLVPEDREKLLKLVEKVLKKGGIFIFDVLNDKKLEEKVSPINWEVSQCGFWKATPYLTLSKSFLYETEKVILSQHTIVDEDDKVDVYRFWTHFFSNEDLLSVLKNTKLKALSFHDDILPDNDVFSGENVTFCKAVKK